MISPLLFSRQDATKSVVSLALVRGGHITPPKEDGGRLLCWASVSKCPLTPQYASSNPDFKASGSEIADEDVSCLFHSMCYISVMFAVWAVFGFLPLLLRTGVSPVSPSPLM